MVYVAGRGLALPLATARERHPCGWRFFRKVSGYRFQASGILWDQTSSGRRTEFLPSVIPAEAGIHG
jgi:hypothetical protein